MGLLDVSRVKRKARYFIHYIHRDNELDYEYYESDIDEFGPKNCRESF